MRFTRCGRAKASICTWRTAPGAIAHKVNGSERHVTLTQAAYDALATKDPATYYHISG